MAVAQDTTTTEAVDTVVKERLRKSQRLEIIPIIMVMLWGTLVTMGTTNPPSTNIVTPKTRSLLL